MGCVIRNLLIWIIQPFTQILLHKVEDSSKKHFYTFTQYVMFVKKARVIKGLPHEFFM